MKRVHDLMGLTEIGEYLGVSRQRAAALASTPGFPAPIDELAAGRVWSAADVASFAATWDRRRGGRRRSGAETTDTAETTPAIPNLWTPSRRSVWQALGTVSQDCARLYVEALRLLDGPSDDDFSFAATGFRSVLERLAEEIGGTVSQEGQEPDLKGAAQDVVSAWGKVRESVVSDEGLVGKTVDAQLAKALLALDQFAAWMHAHRPRRRVIARRVIETLRQPVVPSPPWTDDALAATWHSLYSYFSRVIHHAPSGGPEEFLNKVGAFERLILDLLRPPVLDELTQLDILMRETPSDVAAVALRDAIKGNVHERYVLQRLDDPRWLTSLVRSGLMSSPPSSIRDGSQISFPAWPIPEYLGRMAEREPAGVVAAIKAIPPTDNIRIHGQLMDVISQLPSKDAAKFAATVAEWMSADLARYLNMHEAAKVLQKIASAGNKRGTLKLAEELFSPADSPRDRAWDYRQAMTTCLEALVETGQQQTLDLLIRLLERSIESHSGPTPRPPQDISWMWRPSVETDASADAVDDIRSTLVWAVRRCAELLIQRGTLPVAAVVASLKRGPWHVEWRLSLHAARIGADLDSTVGRDLLLHAGWFEEFALRHEYALLAKRVFPTLTSTDKSEYLGLIQRGPDRQALRTFHADSHHKAPLDEWLQERLDTWTRDRLAPIAEHLTGVWSRRYRVLVKKYGAPPSNDSVWEIQSGVVELKSPLTAFELETMRVEDVVAFLRDWRWTGEFNDPTPDGLGRRVSAWAQSHAAQVSDAAERFVGLAPTYVRSYLAGIREAVARGDSVSWPPVLALCAWAITQADGPGDRDVLRFGDEDPGWGWTRLEIARLLSAGLEGSASLPSESGQLIWRVLSALLDDQEPTPEDEAKFGPPNMDPATYSINTVRGEAMHAAMRYAVWRARAKGDGKPDGVGLETEVSAALVRRLDAGVEPSLAVRAAIGQWAPWLVVIDPSWTSDNLLRIFSDDERGRAAWSSYLLVNKLYTDVVRVLRPVYEHAAREGGADEAADQRLLEHLVILYIRGWEWPSLDDPASSLRAVYGRVSSTTRARILHFFLGRSLAKEEGWSEEQLVRIRRLVEWRLDELASGPSTDNGLEEAAAIASIVSTPPMDEAWALGRLAAVLALGAQPDDPRQVIAWLTHGSPQRLRERLRCLDMIVRRDAHGWRLPAAMSDITALLENALQDGDPEIRGMAQDTMNFLAGRHGIDLRHLIGPSDSPLPAESV
jgi:hypothetical protein